MKIVKKIVAVISAVVMLSCATAVTASAVATNAATASITRASGTMTYTSKQTSPRQWYISTSYNVANRPVYCSGVGTYYTGITKTTATTGNGNGSGTSGTSATLFNDYGYGWYKCVSDHSATAVDGSVVSYNGLTKYGTFVN